MREDVGRGVMAGDTPGRGWWTNTARDVERTSYELQTIETVARGYLNTMQKRKKKKI